LNPIFYVIPISNDQKWNLTLRSFKIILFVLEWVIGI
jgi:hypothetical protein